MAEKPNGQIALQIMPTAGSQRGSGSSGVGGGDAGGPLGEWARKLTSFGCVATWVLTMVGVSLTVACIGFYFVYNDNADTTCIGSFAGITFSYISWLRVLCFTFVGSLLLEIVLVGIHGCTGTVLTSKLAKWWGILMYVFQTAWYIVGAILYWKTVVDQCQQGTQIQIFSLALFIIQTTTVLCLVCGRKAAQSVE